MGNGDPQLDGQTQGRLQPAAEQAGKPAPLRILAVEDSPSDFEYLLAVLGGSGRPLVSRRVEDERAMAAALAETDWDVVISDNRLPRFSAAGALETLRRSGKDLPFIIVSGTIGEEVAVQAMQSGADDYVMKSNLLRLMPAVERSIQAAESRRKRRKAKRKQRESEERLQAVASNFPGVVFQLRYDQRAGRFTSGYFSAGAERLMGVSAEELGETPEIFFSFIGASDRASLEQAVIAGAQHGETIRWEGRLKSPPGSEPPWVELCATPRPSSGDNQMHIWEGVITDATSRKRAEQKLIESQETLRAVTVHHEAEIEEERERFARELHDESGSLLTALKISIANLAGRCGADAEVLAATRQCTELVDAAAQSARRIALALRPPVLDSGIVETARWQSREFEKHTGIQCKVSSNVAECDPGRAQTTALYRILQEALTNIAKHAGATAVDIQLFADGSELTLEIRDNGKGLPESQTARPDAFGLRGMAERVRVHGGWLEISSQPGKGTTIMAAVPLAKSGEGAAA
jgi:two-component system, NarL family, sensor histidine kinase UhpB